MLYRQVSFSREPEDDPMLLEPRLPTNSTSCSGWCAYRPLGDGLRQDHVSLLGASSWLYAADCACQSQPMGEMQVVPLLPSVLGRTVVNLSSP
jgi:hypothetical protein